MKLKKTIVCFIALMLALFYCSVTVSADDGMNYILDNDGKTHLPTPLTYSVDCFTNDFGSNGALRDATDICIAKDGSVYVADTGNNRIVKLDANLNYLASYAYNNSFNSPKGIFVDDDGDMYISDTGNERIVHLDKNGGFIEKFVKPKSDLLDKNMDFQIGRIGISKKGYIYTIRGQYFMEIDSHNEFKGFVGTNRVGFSLKSMLIRAFASKEQKEKMVTEQPNSYNSFTIGNDGLIYATLSGDVKTAQIQVINMVEKNIYPLSFYGETVFNSGTGKVNYPQFKDIAVSDGTLIFALEHYSKCVYVYDKNGQLITVFGGEGNVKGRFGTPIAIDVSSSGEVYVLDKEAGAIHRFSPTTFMKSVYGALKCYDGGNYDESLELWSKVLDTDSNYTVANKGIGNCYYKYEKYSKAMEYYRIADDTAGYGKAFSDYRHDTFRKHFVLVVIISVVIFSAVLALCAVLKKRSDKMLVGYFSAGGIVNRTPIGMFNHIMLTLCHPLDSIDILKAEVKKKRSYLAVPLLLALCVIVNYTSVFYTHYSLSSKRPENADFLIEAAIVILPFLSFTVATYFMSSIMNGESKFSEQITAYSYALVPYIILKPIISLLSLILSSGEVGFYNFLQIIALGWTLILIFTAIKRLNDYSLWTAIAVTLLALLMVVIMWALILLIASLTIQTGSFFTGIFEEFSMEYLS